MAPPGTSDRQAGPQLPARLGERFGSRYEIGALIGRGATGAVFEAFDRKLQQTVALKILPAALADSQEQVARFQRQAELGARVAHPGIVKVSDQGCEDGRHFVAMERLYGETLADRLRRNGTLAAQMAARLVADLADAVAAGHRAGVVHRDIKPANVFLEVTTDGLPRPRLLDFGAAKWLGEPVAFTRSRQTIGTAAYMSPEQARDPKRVDARTDIYALGVILYECLAGRRPFVGRSTMDILVQVINDPAPPLVGHEHPEDLLNIMQIAMDRNPEARHAKAEDLAHALYTFVEASSPSGPNH